MSKSVESELRIRSDSQAEELYLQIIEDIIQHEKVLSMKNFIQHGNTSCLEHSLYVSYNSFLHSRRMGLDYRSVARGGLLHDFFLYDWHGEKPKEGLHGFIHPSIALENASKYFDLNKKEIDIIENHMWPLTIGQLPKYKETFVVISVDKYCSSLETLKLVKKEDFKFKRFL